MKIHEVQQSSLDWHMYVGLGLVVGLIVGLVVQLWYGYIGVVLRP